MWSWREWLWIGIAAILLVFLVAVVVATQTVVQSSRKQRLQMRSTPATLQAALPVTRDNDMGLGAIPQIHYVTEDRITTVTLDLTGPVYFQAHRLTHPDRVYFDLRTTQMTDYLHGKLIQVAVEDSLLRKIRLAERQPGGIRLVLETKRSCGYSAMIASAPYRLIIKLHPF